MKQEKTGRKILVRSRNSLALTSLSWQSLKGALLVSLRTIWTFSNGTIRLYRKVVGIFLTLPKLWCQEIISYAIIFVVCSVVYMPLATGFCFIKISKAIAYTQWYIKSRSTSQMQLVFITSCRSFRCRVPIGDLLILAQNQQQRARKKAR